MIKIVIIIFWSYIISFVESNLGGVLCRLPKDSGYQCGMSIPHSAYHFDVSIGECIEFIFNGCGGNQNRFATKDDCMLGCGALARCGKGLPLMDFAGNLKRCDGDRIPCPGGFECIGQGMNSVCCRKADRICGMSVDAGKICGTVSETRYFYDGGANLCRPFAYLGCAGNENNFKSKGECLKFCAQQIYCLKGDPWPDRYAVSRIATCHTNKDCPNNYTCIQRNNRRACCPSTEYVCGTLFDTKTSCRRNGGDKQIGWTFNFKKGQCEKINVAGCPDQLNDFATLEQCEDYCIGNCPDGSEPHINPFTGQPQMCSIKSNIGCPLGFECVRKSKFSAVCCKSSPNCPAPESLMLTNMGQSEAVRCVPGIESSCPEGYTCQEASNHEHICCTPPLDCPFGMRALREDFNRPHVCTPGILGNCPKDGYYCIRADLGPLQPLKSLCCKPEKKCVLPYVNEKTQRPVKCFPGDQKCPTGTHCLEIGEEEKEKAKTIGLIFYCCYDVEIFTCPNGEMPLITPDNKPQRCNLSDPKSCPVDYSCTTLLDDSFACCSVPDKQKLCKHPITKSDGNPIPCGGEDDTQTCAYQKGKCKRTLDMNYNCCR